MWDINVAVNSSDGQQMRLTYQEYEFYASIFYSHKVKYLYFSPYFFILVI